MGANSVMSEKDKSRSISKRLSNLARERKVPYRSIMMTFYLERLLARVVSVTGLQDHLVFKGGYVGLRVYNSQRYTIDLDAVLFKKNFTEILQETTQVIESNLGDCTWFKFQEKQDLLTQGENEGVRQIYRSGLGEMPKDTSMCDVVHFDIGVGDAIVPGPVESQMQSILEGESLSWKVYPVESIIAEKVHAFISRKGDSSRSKDIFDLAFFLPKANPKLLKEAIKACFKHRNTRLPESIYEKMYSFDFILTKKGWLRATSSLVEKVTFDSCLKTVFKELKHKVG